MAEWGTVEWAEMVVMAAEVGHFKGTRSDLAHAVLILKALEKGEEKK